ncbi:DUF222 domain-containing protein [Citricoccus sp. I39-566]|uniref:HNH endonuclease n=1 Tax=Citricoccus sp. I39-566 TaxID=3073268 RepID=UPI00286BD410|nr:DUF222 domain-containing protein [Citricoccus sp. I39-566]WMY77770.1 DUF222 domain-containing protein [Citricoccus sp. I39-566]
MFEDSVREDGGAADLLACVSVLSALPVPVSEAEAVDRIRSLEELKAACAAAQARTTAALHGLRTEAEAQQGVPVRDRGRGLAAEVALARRESPNTGSRDLGLARALCEEMPHTLAALTRGAISEWKATIMCRETAWLPVQDRREVDELMADCLEELGVKKLAGVARAHAQRLDQASAVAQMDRSVRERRVSVRPASGGMAYLTALLPMAQAVGCLGRLKKSAATTVGTGDRAERTQDQVMADLLVERLTGQAHAEDVPVEIHLVMTDRSLWGTADTDTTPVPAAEDLAAQAPAAAGPAPHDPADRVPAEGPALHGPAEQAPAAENPGDLGPAADEPAGLSPAEASLTPAWLVGHGPIPAEVARRVISDSEAEVFIRRLYTEPASGQLVAMDSTRRTFSGALRQLILVRDDTCRTPYCDAPVKHVDHVIPYRAGGPTSASNGAGLCARCNYSKENPDWSHAVEGDAVEGDRLAVTTPTGHRYTVRNGPLVAGAPPGSPPGRPTTPSTARPPDVSTNPPHHVSQDARAHPVLGHLTYWPANSLLEQGMIQLLMTAAVARRSVPDAVTSSTPGVTLHSGQF